MTAPTRTTRIGSRKDKIDRARRHAADLAPTIHAIRATGATTISDIATELNRLGIPTPRGSGEWRTGQVHHVLQRLGALRAQTYHLVVVRHGPSLWGWEVYRKGEPLPIRLRNGNYQSNSTARAAGRVALIEFLRALEQDQDV
jgi:Recombinase